MADLETADELADRHFASAAIHGDLGQGAREQALRAFRTEKVDVLVATDVAARGIDVDDVTHVINYQSPEDEKIYLHRIGRTGRAGNAGTAVTFVDWDDMPRWSLINNSLGLGLAACQKGRKVGFTTAAILVHELMEAVDDRRLQRLQKSLATHDLLIIDELGFVPLSKTGAELLFEVISQRYERGSIIITSNLPFDEWTEVFGSERLTGAILDRLTHHVHILEMNGDSYRLAQSRTRRTA